MLRDLVQSGRNLLLLGRPGVGKTTKLREIARVLADDFAKRVVVVDTSNEIGGDGDVPHPGIGGARRMQVARPDRQHAVMIEAVENHMPEVIIVDEIGTAAEAQAARTIAERGVQLIGTAHGTTLENLVLNPTLADLIGGTHTVTLSDEEARRRRTPKTITERRGPPTFDTVVEIVDRSEVVAHTSTADAVDHLLAGRPLGGERRRLRAGTVVTEKLAEPPAPALAPPGVHIGLRTRNGPPRIYAHGVSRDLLGRVIEDMGIQARLVGDPERADVILALRGREDRPPGRAEVHTLKKNSSAEIRRILRNVFSVVAGVDEDLVREAVTEAEHAIARVITERVPVSLAPRPPELRKVQHRLVSRHHLEAASTAASPSAISSFTPRAAPTCSSYVRPLVALVALHGAAAEGVDAFDHRQIDEGAEDGPVLAVVVAVGDGDLAVPVGGVALVARLDRAASAVERLLEADAGAAVVGR
jgi:nucleoside-triphosphatase THEP1